MLDTTKRKRVSGTIVPMPSAKAEAINLNQIANVDAEAAVIGAVLRDPAVFASISEVLQPSDFYVLRHGFIWYAFDQIAARGEVIDLISLADELAHQKQWTDKSEEWLSSLAGAAPSSAGAETYARMVREAALRLRVLAAADEMKRVALDKERYRDVEAAIDECNRLLFEATDQQLARAQTSMQSIIESYAAEVRAAQESGVMPGLPYGLCNLDALMKTSVPGEISVFGGGEGMGKTTLVLSAARNHARAGKTVVIFTLEMTQQEIGQIFIGMETGIARRALKAMDLTAAQYEQFNAAAAVVAGWNTHIIDEFPALTPIQLRRRLRTLMQADGVPVDLVIIDGLWLMEDTDGEVERHRAVFKITRDLRQIGIDFDVPIWITHQYNGEAWHREDKRPRIIDLAESAGVRRNCQIIFGLYRDSYYRVEGGDGYTELHVLKDRNGSGAQGQAVEFGFDVARSLFIPAQKVSYNP